MRIGKEKKYLSFSTPEEVIRHHTLKTHGNQTFAKLTTPGPDQLAYLVVAPLVAPGYLVLTDSPSGHTELHEVRNDKQQDSDIGPTDAVDVRQVTKIHEPLPNIFVRSYRVSRPHTFRGSPDGMEHPS